MSLLRSLALAAVFLSSPSLAAPPAPDELASVLTRWVDAVGGEKRVKAARAVELRAEADEDGMKGTVEESFDGASWRRRGTWGGRTSEASWTGSRAWSKDWNGKVQELAGRDRADRMSEAMIHSLIFGDALTRLASSPEVALAAGEASDKTHRLEFTPSGGIPFTVFLDKATALPVKVVRKPYDDELTLELSGWRVVNGRKVPFSLRETASDEEGGAATFVRELLRRSAPIGRPVDGASDVRYDAGRSSVGIPFNFENDHLMVEGRVNGGTPLWFMLDTGAEATIINRARMAELGLTPFGAASISGGGNATDFAYTDVSRLRVGAVELVNQRDGVIDLSGLERIYGMPMGGILGYDFFSRFVVQVHYAERTIDLSDPASFTGGGDGVPVRFLLEKGQPHAAATITVPSAPPIAADVIIDSGAADTVNLTAPFVRAHRLTEVARKRPAGAPNTMAGSEKEFFAQTSVRGRLEAISLGSFSLTEIPCNLMVGTKGAYASSAFSGTVGQGVLRRFDAVYDYAKSRLILTPNADFAKPFPPRRTFGATLLADGPGYTKFTVTGVRKDSPAAAAGLAKEDVIAAVDGKPAATLRLADLRKLLTDEGSHHVLEIQRGDGRLAIPIDVTLVSLDDN